MFLEAGDTEIMHGLLSCIRRDDVTELRLLLILSGANLNEKDVFGFPLLVTAVKLNSMACTKLLIDLGADPNLSTAQGLTPLCEASDNGRLDFVQLLISKGADPHLVTSYARTPLVRAVGSAVCGLDVVRHLVKLGVNLDHSTYNDGSALTSACRSGQMDKLLFLLDAGADINRRDRLGYSPLEMAVLKGYLEIVYVLLRRGADPSRGLAFLSRYNEGNEVLAGRLLEAGADVNFRHGGERETPLSRAVHEGQFRTARVLLQFGATVGHALHVAVHEGKDEILGDLIRAGATPHLEQYSHIGTNVSQSEKLMTPFSFAVETKNFHLARAFLSAWFLHDSDVSHVVHSPEMGAAFHEHDLSDSTAWLRDIRRRPLSLSCLSFVAVSTSLGFGPDREGRISQLQVPAVVKDLLLYRGLSEDLGAII
ncbi:ankyrin repeat domain-containing protein 29 [Aplysia californica]|uniref:Ankyrin repeat domain-containing protein 29 n=1 Tax=Aplysia californica TaxID=6500 RepID=A0ABM0JD74_APLCA|nr:ankyrin repeat domain-containing protein 29 [Aplysia californica]